MILENDTPFTDCISEISNRQVDNTKDLDIAMPLYNLIKCSSSYSKKSGSFWQYCRGGPEDNIKIFDDDVTDDYKQY